jgi:hypothetical protein
MVIFLYGFGSIALLLIFATLTSYGLDLLRSVDTNEAGAKGMSVRTLYLHRSLAVIAFVLGVAIVLLKQ